MGTETSRPRRQTTQASIIIKRRYAFTTFNTHSTRTATPS